MGISIEIIDEMRKRTNCSYQEAKELLEKHNGDLIDAIVDFEKNQGQRSKETKKQKENDSGFGQKVKNLVDKGFITRFVIEKEENTFLNISINILVLAIIITMPIFWLYPIALIIVYLMGYRIRIRKEEGKDIDINEFVDGIGNRVRSATDKKSAQPQKTNQEEKKEEKKDGYNEITIE